MPNRKPIDKLYFIFDANAGTLSALVDSAKKLLSIKGCPLCTITHSLAGEKSEWKSCKQELGVPVEYVHRDEVSDSLRQASGGELPCVIAETGDELYLLLDPQVLARCKGSVGDLKGRLLFYAAKYDLTLPDLPY